MTHFIASAETLIIGRGRVATQLIHFFESRNLSFSNWCRSSQGLQKQNHEELLSLFSKATRVLLPISDKSISEFIDQHKSQLAGKLLVHFSAAHRDERALGFHPLGSFTLDQKVDFSKVYFQGIHPESLFREALPMFSNPYTQLSETDMQLYHALCVYGGNFSAILWKNFFQKMQHMGVPREALNSYVQNITDNVLANPEKAVTGPLVRGDQATIEKNLKALEHEPKLHAIYESFVRNR